MMADRQHVLVVDDEPVLRMILVDLLEGEGYAVEEASNAAEALEVLQALPSIRIVVTDIQMPGSMDGLRLARYIRDAYPPIALIVSSGTVRPEQGALPDDAVFLSKPVDHRELLRVIEDRVSAA
jgi:two-component system, response regulator PdtaR